MVSLPMCARRRLPWWAFFAPALPVLVEQPGRSTLLLFDQTLPSTTITYTYSLYRLTDAVRPTVSSSTTPTMQ